MKVSQILYEDVEGQKLKRAEFIKKTYEAKWPEKGVPDYKTLDKLIEKVAAVDPTKNGAYMQWMIKMIMKDPQENKPEDLDRTGEDLKSFETFKSKIENKDINSYKSFIQLFDVIAPLNEPKEKTPEDKKAAAEAKKLEELKKEILLVYTGSEGWIRVPTTERASCWLGQNTRWCTAAKNNNYFASYNKNDRLFVIYDKASKERIQIHIQSGQFMDVQDRPLAGGAKAIPEWARPPLIAWYKENSAKLTHTQLLRLQDIGDVSDVVKGTAHEDVFALMKKYGI